MKKDKTLFKCSAFEMKSGERKLPNGHVSKVAFIQHPGAVAIIPMLSKGKIVLLRQYRPVVNDWVYEIPAGTLDRGESPFEAASRELAEETGYKGTLEFIGEIRLTPGYSSESLSLFRATNLSKTYQDKQESEVIETHVFGKRTIREMEDRLDVMDAKTLIALYRIGWLR